MDLNKVQIIGRVTQDVEVKQTPNGTQVTTFSVATNRTWTDNSGGKQEQAEYHNIVLWAKLAEIAGQYVEKGKQIYIEGRLQTRSWEAQDGSKRYRTEIIGENLILLGGGGKSEDSGKNYAKKPVPKREEEIEIEDLPFR